jgi:DNA-binding protein H-NS
MRQNAGMKKIDLQSISTDELWAFHEEIISILSERMKAEKQKLEELLERLGIVGKALEPPQQRRPYPKVVPRFRNPELHDQTWSGRGKQPNWIRRVLADGKTMDDCRILSDSPNASRFQN